MQIEVVPVEHGDMTPGEVEALEEALAGILVDIHMQDAKHIEDIE